MSGSTWKEELGDRIPSDLSAEIDIFETEIALRKEDKFDEVIFAETRLRRGVYGQRYDNGQRFDGQKTQQLNYPAPPTKGRTRSGMHRGWCGSRFPSAA